MPDGIAPIQQLAEREAYRNSFITLYDDEVRFPDGSSGTYVRMETGDGSPSSAVLVTSRGRVALVLVYRYPIQAWEWGIPRGMASAVRARDTALNELKEELGGEPETLELLGVIHPDSGLLASRVEVFHAVWPEPHASAQDTNEVQGLKWVSWAELRRLVTAGEITDSFTIAALTFAWLHGLVDEAW